MYTIYKLTLASLKMYTRNRQALFFALFMPFMIMIIFGYIGFDNPQKIDVGLVTHAPNQQTATFVDVIRKFPTFNIKEGSLDEEKSQLDQGNLSVVLDVPDTLIAPGQTTPGKVTAYINAGKAGEGQAVVSILDQTIYQMTLQQSGTQPIASIESVSVNAHNLRYIEFLLPGLIALSVMQAAVFSVAFVFTQYKEKGLLKRLLATPMRPFQFVIANGITRLIMSVIQALIFIIMGLILFKAHVVGAYWLLFLCVIMGSIMFLGLGFTISGIAKTADAVPAVANLVVFPMMFLGGTFFAVSNMPWWLQAVAKYLPLTFFSGAVRDVMTKGSGFFDISHDLLGMFVWAAILVTLATVTFSFQEKDAG